MYKSIIIIFILLKILIINGHSMDDDYVKLYKPFPDNPNNPVETLIHDPVTQLTYVIGRYQSYTPIVNKDTIGFGFITVGTDGILKNNNIKKKPTTTSKSKTTTISSEESTSEELESKEVYDSESPDKEDTHNFKILKASVYNGCMVFLGQSSVDNSTFLTLLNTNQTDARMSYRLLPIDNFSSVGIDETFIWATYTKNGKTMLKPYTHSNTNIGRCKGFIPADRENVIKVKQPDTIVSQPITTTRDRFVYIYDKSDHVIVKSNYISNVSLTETHRINVGAACSIQMYGMKNGNTFWMASYDNGFKIFTEKEEKSTNLILDDGKDYCGNFASKGLDTFYVKPGSNEIHRTIPGLTFEVKHSCYGDGDDGEIKIITDIPNDFIFKWDDEYKETTSLIRTKLKDGNYTLEYRLKDYDHVDDVVRRIINVKTPADPTFVNITTTCRSFSNGTLNFTSEHHKDLTYTYHMFDVSKNKTTINEKNGVFKNLFGNSKYIVKIDTIDMFNNKCSYNKTIYLENEVVETLKYESTNQSCYNTKDASIKILNYNPSKYIYSTIPNVYNITSTGMIENIHHPNVVILVRNKTGICEVSTPVDIMSPPNMVVPVILPIKPKCYGGTGSLILKVLPGVEFELIDKNGREILPYLINVNQTTRYKNLYAGNYKLTTVVKSTRDGRVCNTTSYPFKVGQPHPIKIKETYIESVDCTSAHLANMILEAEGGVPMNGTNYDFSLSSESRFRGSYLNVSYWIDAVYSVNVSDSNQCVSMYNNITIKRPSKCQVHNLNGINQPQPNSLQNSNNHHKNDKDDKNKLGLILGLCLGIGIPFILLATALTVFLVKKYGHTSTPTVRNPPRPNTVPVFMGGKIHNIDNF